MKKQEAGGALPLLSFIHKRCAPHVLKSAAGEKALRLWARAVNGYPLRQKTAVCAKKKNAGGAPIRRRVGRTGQIVVKMRTARTVMSSPGVPFMRRRAVRRMSSAKAWGLSGSRVLR